MATQQMVLSPRDASILSLIARVSGNPARQLEVFDRNRGLLETEFANKVAQALVGQQVSDEDEAATRTANAMKNWVTVKVAQSFDAASRKSSKLKRASAGSLSRARARLR